MALWVQQISHQIFRAAAPRPSVLTLDGHASFLLTICVIIKIITNYHTILAAAAANKLYELIFTKSRFKIKEQAIGDPEYHDRRHYGLSWYYNVLYYNYKEDITSSRLMHRFWLGQRWHCSIMSFILPVYENVKNSKMKWYLKKDHQNIGRRILEPVGWFEFYSGGQITFTASSDWDMERTPPSAWNFWEMISPILNSFFTWLRDSLI